MSKSLTKNSLKGKTVWLTGGKRIGQEIAAALAELGADLVITYRTSEKEAREIEEKAKLFGNKILIAQADVSDRASVRTAAERIGKELGKLDILILLASVFRPVGVEKIGDEDWDSNVSVHIKGTFWPIQASLPLMPAGSRIITVSDRTAVGRPYPGYLPYIVTKSAIAAMTRALAVELGPKGIFVNTIAPGPILKPDDISDTDWQEIRRASMIKYPITDDEATREFVDTVIRLCFVRSSSGVYPLDLGHLF